MHSGFPSDVAGAMARLEAGISASSPPESLAVGPVTPFEAVRLWCLGTQMRPGAYRSPGITKMCGLFTAYAKTKRWTLDGMTTSAMGRALRKLGFIVKSTGSVRSAFVDGPTSRRLWASTPPILRPPHKAKRKPLAPRPVAPLFWELLNSGRLKGRARPLVDSLGRVWPSARAAQALLPRARQAHIQASASGRGKQRGAAGVLWRYLTQEELARIPLLHKSGQVVEWAAWGRTVAVSDSVTCASCGAVCDATPKTRGGHPPGFPTHPLNGT